MSLLLAQLLPATMLHWILVLIVVIAAVAILYVFLNQAGIQIPQFVIRVFWIVLAAAIAILAIKFLAGL